MELEKEKNDFEKESKFINNSSIFKYFAVYIPLLFILNSIIKFLWSNFSFINFNWKLSLFEAIFLALFLRVFHTIRNS